MDITDTVDADTLKTIYNPLNLPGLFYVCHACQPKTIPNDDEGDNKQKRRCALSVKATPEMQEDNPRQEVLCPNNSLPTQTAREEEKSQTEINHTQTGEKRNGENICPFYKTGN